VKVASKPIKVPILPPWENNIPAQIIKLSVNSTTDRILELLSLFQANYLLLHSLDESFIGAIYVHGKILLLCESLTADTPSATNAIKI
jgi:hypothetical protein